MQTKKSINIEVGHRIQLSREQRGYTQEQFAELLDVGAQHVSRIERGVVGISLSALKRTCEILEVSADYLLLGKSVEGERNIFIQQLSMLPIEQEIHVERGIMEILNALSLANQ